ncbi:MAG TPA: hypothetical protein VLB90_10130 [Pseudomonadales bacterium]|nr:hypothetical protein [Pseudomonadales bacterium]
MHIVKAGAFLGDATKCKGYEAKITVIIKLNALKWHATPLRHMLTLLVLLSLAVAARIRVVFLDFNSLVTYYLQDDGFYYYKIAANIFNLHRVTYDGEQLSNGYHPLWLALITLFYTPANDGIDFVYRAQWLMLCCALLTVVALYITLLRVRAGWFPSAIVTAVFCVHAYFVDMQMNGLETSLNTLMLLLIFNAFLTVFLQPDSSLNRYIYFGVIVAGAFLARTDNGITLLLLFCVLAWQTRRSAMQYWPRIFLSGVLAALLVSPWLIWNQVNFGSLIQTSGKLETIYWGEPHFDLGRTVYSLALTPPRVYEKLKFFWSIFFAPLPDPSYFSAVFMVWFAISMSLMIFSNRSTPALRALAFFCIAMAAVFSYNAGIRNLVRMWYYVPVGLFSLLSIAGFSAWFRNFLKSRVSESTATVIPVCILLLWFASVVWLYSPAKLSGIASERSPHLVVADWIQANTPPDAIIGSMNSGILSYLAQRKVINLDGVVDQRSLKAHWEKNEIAYIHERGIRYLVDNDGALRIFCHENPLHTCKIVFTFGIQANPSRVVQIVDKN